MPVGGAYGEIEQIGLIKAICPVEARSASAILWPETPEGREFPWLIFFETEVGTLKFSDFLNHLDYLPNWDLKGWFKPIKESRFERWGGATGYYRFLQETVGFRPLPRTK